MAISYQITLVPEQHIYQIRLEFIATSDKHILSLPVWIPGSYMLREFSKNIITLHAIQGSGVVDSQQITKNSWELSSLALWESVAVNYSVYAYEFGIRTAFLDTLRGYFNPTSLCLALLGAEESHHRVNFANLVPGWQVACGLGFNSAAEFVAENYAQLVDSPFELGKFKRLDFELDGVKHYLVLSGTIPVFAEERLLADIRKICAYQLELFAGGAPYSDYTFMLNLSGDSYTGLEHRNSTLLMAPYYALPNLSASNDEDYHKLLGLISHEFFHTWNVKRIKPQAFISYDLNNENYTKLLWWFEGVTSYYDDLVLYRSAIISRDKYLGLVVDNLNNVYKFNGVNNQSLSNSSLTSWVKYYRQDENSPNSLVSYYLKGAIVALCLDLAIRHQSSFSLDDVLRLMYQRWQTNHQGIAEDEIPALIKLATGVDLSEFIQLATETSEALPLDELFANFGLSLTCQTAKSHQDKAKVTQLVDKSKPVQRTLDLGAKLEKSSIGYLVKNVYHQGSAEIAGLAANDLIIAINGIKLSQLEKQLAFYSAGERVELAILRQERLLMVGVTLSTCVATIYNLFPSDEAALSKWL